MYHQKTKTGCCGNGCVPCVFDIYEEEVKIWESECKRIRRKVKQNISESVIQVPYNDGSRIFKE